MHIYKIEDGGHFISFNQNICRSKQDMKKRQKSIIYSLKSFSNEKIKNYIAIFLNQLPQTFLTNPSKLYLCEILTHVMTETLIVHENH